MNIQALCMWAGCYTNGFARQLGRDLERISRPFKYLEPGYEKTALDESTTRIKRLIQALMCAPLSLAGTTLASVSFSLAYAFCDQRLEVIGSQSTPLTDKRTIRLLSLNVCFQEGPFAPLAGGVVPPFDKVNEHATRVSAIAHWIGTQQQVPDIVCGQEFTALLAQDAFVAEMKKHGYRHFIIDRAPHPLFMNSGLLIASKLPLSQPSFIDYPYEDRFEGGKIVQQGAIKCTVLDSHNRPLFRLLNTHLNAGEGREAQMVRNRQLKKHLLPHLRARKLPTLLAGDLNFDTSNERHKTEAGLKRYVNIFAGCTTWTNEGIIHLRGIKDPLVTDKLDAVITNSRKITFSNNRAQKVVLEEMLLSDHYAVSTTLTLL